MPVLCPCLRVTSELKRDIGTGEHHINHRWLIIRSFSREVSMGMEHGGGYFVTCISLFVCVFLFLFCFPVAEGGWASGSTSCAESGTPG